jgi:hypothetical protein
MNSRTGAILATVAITGALAGCTASASSAGSKPASPATAAASASDGSDLAGQLASSSQLCADVLQNGYPVIGVDQAKMQYDQWSAEAGKEGHPALAVKLARVGADAAAVYADETAGRDPEAALGTYGQAADAVGAQCSSGTQ